MKSLLKVLAPTVLLLLSTASHAFDNNRQGFLLSIGAGLSTANVNSNNGAGMGTSFKIGGGFNNQFTAYYVRNVAWTSPMEESVGFSAAGASYYFDPNGHSPFLSFAIGIGDSLDIDNIGDTGPAIMVGGGFQLSNRLTIEGNYFNTELEGDFGTRSDVSAFQVTLQATWF